MIEKVNTEYNYNAPSAWNKEMEADEVYYYYTEDGKYAFEVQRQGRGKEKALRTGRSNMLKPGARLNPEDHWEWKSGRGESPALLYRLPELVAAGKEPRTWLTEGEPDTNILIAHGETATTNPHGALAWKPEHAEKLTGHHVVICVDHDDAGETRFRMIRASLLGKAASVSVVRFDDMPVGFDVRDFLEAGHTLDELRARVQPLPDPIIVKPEKLSENVSDIERALIEAKAEIYGRSDKLVRPIKDVGGHVMLFEMSAHDVRDHISKHVEFVKYNSKGRLVPTGPTMDMAHTLMARVGLWNFPEISGVRTAPILRANGDVFAKSGYDALTGLYFVLPDGEFTIGTTKEEARVALSAIKNELLCDFPYVTDADLSVMLSGMITPLVRPMMNVVPLHAIRAHTPGTGKSYFVDCCSMLSLGVSATALTVTGDEDEDRKLLSTVAMTGEPIISLDNLNGELRGVFLCQLVEQSEVRP